MENYPGFASLSGNELADHMMEQIERFLISYEGLGRKDQIDALSAGGKLPDAYYQDGSKRNFLEVHE